MDDQILSFWLEKYTPQIINYITMVVQFEELTQDKLEEKRRSLLLEYLDASDSSLLIYLTNKIPNFLNRLYAAIYSRKEMEKAE